MAEAEAGKKKQRTPISQAEKRARVLLTCITVLSSPIKVCFYKHRITYHTTVMAILMMKIMLVMVMILMVIIIALVVMIIY